MCKLSNLADGCTVLRFFVVFVLTLYDAYSLFSLGKMYMTIARMYQKNMVIPIMSNRNELIKAGV